MLAQSNPVCNDPSFHTGRHQENLILSGSIRTSPTVTHSEMLPCLFYVRYRIFAVYEQSNISLFTLIMRGLKIIEGIISAATGNNARQASRKTGFSQQIMETFTASSFKERGFSTTFYKDCHFAHQRIPPNCPRIHSSPSRYFSSHTLRSSFESRVSCVCPLCFSQTSTESG